MTADPPDADRSPRLDWTAEGAPRSGRFGDVYFSREDGLAETRAVFLDGCGLPDAWAGRKGFVVGELGFGTGLNIAALLDLWRRTAEPGARLHVFSIEGFPLSREEAARALSAWPELAAPVAALLAAWPDPTPGLHRLDLPDFHAVVDLAIGEVEEALAQWGGRADAWFLDGFAPSTNPAMWSDAVLGGVAAHCAPGARVASFTVAGAVRRGLAAAGFAVEKKPGHGRKRERLEARLPGAAASSGPAPRVAVIGAGIAGAAAVRALQALGLAPVLVEADRPGAGGSGFPASLVTPRLDAGDVGIAALHAQALMRARSLYAEVPGAVLAEGVLQMEQAPRDAARFGRIAAQSWWADGAMTALDAAACSARLGEPVATGGLFMRDALAVSPAAVLGRWLEGAETRAASVADIVRDGEGWRLVDAAGAEILSANVVVLAAGWGAAQLLADAPLSPVRGQADWSEGASTPPVAWGGYAVPAPTGLLFGATHDRGETAPEVSQAASARNQATLAARMPALAARLEGLAVRSRAAVRATTPDRLPLAGEVAQGLFVLTGFGSRGFCLAPLLAEHVAAEIVGAPSPLPRALAERVSPTRFGPLAQNR